MDRSIPFTRSTIERPTMQSPMIAHANSMPTKSYMSKSASIPISNSIRRTSSENLLSQDEADADHRDFLFYSRVVDGISRQQRELKNGYLRDENQMCLAHIVRTRHADSEKKLCEDEEWSRELAEFGLVDNHYHHDPEYHHVESLEDAEMFELDL
jgi:hypothetical protein